MAETTGISWCDSTFNPWEGCTKVSPGCDHCYAEARNIRFGGGNWGPGAPRRRTVPGNWDKPRQWNERAFRSGKPWRVFCASLADVFDNEVPEEWRVDLFNLIAETPSLTWLILTKRIGNALPYKLPANVWLGASVVNQVEAERDIPKLLEVPATKRFLSCEPLLGPITIPGFDRTSWCPICRAIVADAIATPHESVHGVNLFAEFDAAKHCVGVPAMLNWVIAGGESGAKARPMHIDWLRGIRDQCAYAGVPFHFKQWGEWSTVYDRDREDPDWRHCPNEDDGGGRYLNLAGGHGFHGERVTYVRKVGKKASGRALDGREHLEFPT